MDVKKIKHPAFYEQIGTVDHPKKGTIRIGRNAMVPVSFYIFIGENVYTFTINDVITDAVAKALEMDNA